MILLVEDESGIREALCAYLRLRGHEVTGAASLGEALAVLERTSPEHLITDLDLGDGDGRTLVDLVQKHSPDVPILVLSASADGSLASWIEQRSGVLALQKPIRPKRVIEWLDSQTTEREPLGASSLAGLPRAVLPVVDQVIHAVYGRSELPMVERAWSEGDRIRLRVTAPVGATALGDLAESVRGMLMERDLDLWLGGAGCTEISFRLLATETEKGSDLAAFVSTPDGHSIEKIHEDGAWAKQAPSPEQNLDPWQTGREAVARLSEGQLERVDEERRLLWPDASHPEVDARSKAVIKR